MSVLIAVYSSPVTRNLFGSRPPAAPTRPPAAAPPASAPSAAPASTMKEDELAAWRSRHASAWKRDPFFTAEEERALARPPGAAPAPVASTPDSALPSYTVKLVMISGAVKVAAIDGRLVSEGEMLGDERVALIQADGVVLERGGRRRLIEVASVSVPIIENERGGRPR